MELPPLPGLLKVNPTTSFSSVDSEMPLKSTDQVCGRLKYETVIAEFWNHKLMKAEKELVDLNCEVNETLYHANKQKTKVDMSGERITFLKFELFQKHRGHIQLHEHFWEGKAKIEKERNKGFEDSRRLAKGNDRVNHNGIIQHFIVVKCISYVFYDTYVQCILVICT
ncbi:ion channel POLLUX-like 2 [Pyrus ussuriensis x Pyrus communis]|uniref:Ion channel POLLUX-like 2 n=1 Tax=Pyrus ussuriensis x Pyrus communis TaxID=2448454 RepID=A0A5N5GMT6_9ROSA|nr:ion channel POLLUX-like 2 [Pyrus ussuriensis x Pyrus communis]